MSLCVSVCVLDPHVQLKILLEQSSINVPSTDEIKKYTKVIIKQKVRINQNTLLWYITEVLGEPLLAATKRLGEVSFFSDFFCFLGFLSPDKSKHKMAQTHRDQIPTEQ